VIIGKYGCPEAAVNLGKYVSVMPFVCHWHLAVQQMRLYLMRKRHVAFSGALKMMANLSVRHFFLRYSQ
jgi:hypothetical protein